MWVFCPQNWIETGEEKEGKEKKKEKKGRGQRTMHRPPEVSVIVGMFNFQVLFASAAANILMPAGNPSALLHGQCMARQMPSGLPSPQLQGLEKAKPYYGLSELGMLLPTRTSAQDAPFPSILTVFSPHRLNVKLEHLTDVINTDFPCWNKSVRWLLQSSRAQAEGLFGCPYLWMAEIGIHLSRQVSEMHTVL